jgi:hypothetical protein
VGRRARSALLAGVCATAVLVAPAKPAPAWNPWLHRATGGFSTPTGDGFWVTYADGYVQAIGGAQPAGDVSHLSLQGEVRSGASTPNGEGYWLVGADGGIFSFGNARFYGSMGGKRLNQPVFAMTPTKGGRGYWLVARDGGVFSFGDARFHGSTGHLRLNQPIVGMTTTPSGRGYRMVAADGGVFNFGDARFYGSLPGLGIHVNDVVGMAPTPTNKGYWVVRSNGAVYSFGDATYFGGLTASPCDPVTGIIGNPAAPGYRIVTWSGYTAPFGNAPGGSRVTGRVRICNAQTVCRGSLRSAADYQAVFDTRGPVWTGADGAATVDLEDGRRLWLFGDTYSGLADATHILPGYHFLRNSVGVEQGGCVEFRVGGLPGDPRDYITRQNREWFWPMTGVVDRAAGVVRLSAMRLTRAEGPHGFRWRVVRNEIVTLDLRTLLVRSTSALPAGGGHLWGVAMHRDGDVVYMYARGEGGRHYVARAPLNALTTGRRWQYFTGTAWSSDASAARPMKFLTVNGADDPGPLPALTVDRYGSGYLASVKRCDLLCDDLTAWYSASPTGPWRAVNANAGRVATTHGGPGLVVYGGHLARTRAGWLAVWSVNRPSDTLAKYTYGPRVAAPSGLPTADALAAAWEAAYTTTTSTTTPTTSTTSTTVAASAASTTGTASSTTTTTTATSPTTALVDATAVTTEAETDLPTTGGWVNH